MSNSEIDSGKHCRADGSPKLRLLAGALTAGAALLGCGGGGGGAPTATTTITAAACTGLAGKTLANNTVTVLDAAVVAATATLPEYCVVHAGFNDSTLKFEAHLPTSGWNAKLTWFGGGGFDGHFSQPTDAFLSKSIVAEKYATVATNGGYDAPADLLEWFKATFAFDAVKLADFTYLSNHRALPAAQGADPARLRGGRDEELFRGLLDGRPRSHDSVGALSERLRRNRCPRSGRQHHGVHPVQPSCQGGPNTRRAALNAAKQTLLANAVLAQCDALDGLTDGIISKPAACTYDPRRCAAPAERTPATPACRMHRSAPSRR